MTPLASALATVVVTVFSQVAAIVPSPTISPDRTARETATLTAKQDDAATDIYAHRSMNGPTPVSHQRSRDLATVPVVERKLVPACPDNSATNQAEALCVGATQACEAMGQQGISYWLFTRPADGSAGWQLAEQRCLRPEEVAAAAAPVPAVTAEQFRRLPWPPAVVHIQPGNGRTLVNVPTNVYLEAATRVVPTVLLGQQVQVRATPVTYTWSFGDGATLHTSDAGAPYPDLRTTHVYTRAGTMPVGLTTTYRGEYSVAGGAWLPIDGTAQVVTPPADLIVVAARSELVESPLPS